VRGMTVWKIFVGQVLLDVVDDPAFARLVRESNIVITNGRRG